MVVQLEWPAHGARESSTATQPGGQPCRASLVADNNRASRFFVMEGRCPGDLFQEKRALPDREKALYCDYRVG
jgi:hypothetical protein